MCLSQYWDDKAVVRVPGDIFHDSDCPPETLVRFALVRRIRLRQLIKRRAESLTITLGERLLRGKLLVEVIDLLRPRCPAMRVAAVPAERRPDVDKGSPPNRRAAAIAHREHIGTAKLTESVDLFRFW